LDFNRLIELMREVDTPQFQQRLAQRQLERTDPWKWYCRLCGARGESDSRTASRDEAYAHIADGQPCGHGAVKDQAEHGRLLHVWSWSRCR
jgi:hypothetical protein